MRLLGLVLGFLLGAACLRPMATSTGVQPVTDGWCFTAEVNTGRGHESMTGCASSAELCGEALRTAQRYHPMMRDAKLLRLSPCAQQ